MEKQARIYVAGHRGLVGSAILRKLQSEGYENIVIRTSSELDLRNQQQVDEFFYNENIDYVFLAAAKVGGILANNTYPAEFIYDNIMMQSNVIHAAYKYGVKKLLFLGSSCIYPKHAPQPMSEDVLLTGELEPTNEPYAIAKIAGIKMCQAYNRQYGTNFISVMPTNLYGPNDNFEIETSHVLPALIRKFHEAKVNNEPYVTIWGTGKPRRELLHVDDLADACLFLMDNYEGDEPINVGTGEDLQIKELAGLIKKVVGYEGDVQYDLNKPDGTPRKLLDMSCINKLGWYSKIGLEKGIKMTYDWYLDLKNDNMFE
ncbi:MAG: GDP-L-fucose synthase [Clostridiales bacterium]|nr:GDP-L-fucose synthase [Clostridiales bacterium]MCF8023156.1 GDP-L-fucose synthase [Clostridiales bacterium]